MEDLVIGVVGLGYVGLPLAIEFAKHLKVIGFDTSESRVLMCKGHIDPSNELNAHEMKAAVKADFTSDEKALAQADILIVSVPTPVSSGNVPDFTHLIDASRTVAKNLKRGAIVIYESTVYPGATEEICIPILEKNSGLVWKRDFFVGYSPERVNPGDLSHKLTTVVKVVSGDSLNTLNRVAELYQLIVPAGVHRCSSIKIAEASKITENIQRDVNIALMNELAVIFNLLGISTKEVLQAASTKWNFAKYSPGLVGGHCIGVDPYYLVHKSQLLKYTPQVISVARQVNESMGKYIAEKTVKTLVSSGFKIKGASVIVLGLTYKENCTDLRNSKVEDIINELRGYSIEVSVHDPLADVAQASRRYGVDLIRWNDLPVADAIVAAVAHQDLLKISTDQFCQKLNSGGCFIDVTGRFKTADFISNGINTWSL